MTQKQAAVGSCLNRPKLIAVAEDPPEETASTK
jgi:hypothetical protein